MLGSNAKDPELAFLLQGTEGGWADLRFRLDNHKPVPESDFKVHSRFFFLALSLLIEVGVLEVSYRTFPTTEATIREDYEVPYDRRVRSFQEFVFRCDTELSNYTFCFAPQAWHSHLAWRVLVSKLVTTASGRCCGHLSVDCSVFNCPHVVEYIEQRFDYEHQPYWCPLIYRDQPLV